jgi:hypothetical protein
MNETWFCLHVFLSDQQASNDFLLEWLGPKVRALHAERWFFLRYWHGGPHVRIRWKGLDAECRAQVLSEAAAVVPRWASRAPPTRENYYGTHSFDGEKLNVADLPWWQEGSVISLQYEPEWVRYGGIHGLPVNETLFELSSSIALAVLQGSKNNLSQRASVALLLMSAAVLAFDTSGRGQAAFFRRYAHFWRTKAGGKPTTVPQIAGAAAIVAALGEQRARFRAGMRANSAETLWWSGLRRGFEQFASLANQGLLRDPWHGGYISNSTEYDDAILNMLGSQIHMLNNRLGFGPLHECSFAECLANAAAYMDSEATFGTLE